MSPRPDKGEVKLSTDDPAFKAFVEIVDTLEPFSRLEQFRILAAACLLRGDDAYAALFARLAAQEAAKAEQRRSDAADRREEEGMGA